MLDSQIKKQLFDIVGKNYYKDDPEALITHSYDGTPMLQSMPDGVIYPKDTNQVSAIMKILNQHRIPVIGRGSGTNLCGGTVPVQGGVIMVMHRMNAILEVDLLNLTATVQPGIITKQFIEHIEKLDLFYPPDPSSMAISTLAVI